MNQSIINHKFKYGDTVKMKTTNKFDPVGIVTGVVFSRQDDPTLVYFVRWPNASNTIFEEISLEFATPSTD